VHRIVTPSLLVFTIIRHLVVSRTKAVERTEAASRNRETSWRDLGGFHPAVTTTTNRMCIVNRRSARATTRLFYVFKQLSDSIESSRYFHGDSSGELDHFRVSKCDFVAAIPQNMPAIGSCGMSTLIEFDDDQSTDQSTASTCKSRITASV